MVAFHGLIDIRLSSEGSFYLDYAGWYIYLALFLVMSIRHHLEMKQAASTLDFAQYSFDNGKAHKVFLDIDVGGKKGNDRIIECWLEPGAAFLVGFMLALIGQALGWLLMFSAVVYAISYRSAYEAADNSVLDLIDDMIINRGLAESFLNDAAKSETLGYRFLGRKPSDLEKRKVVFEQMMKNRDKDVTIPK